MDKAFKPVTVLDDTRPLPLNEAVSRQMQRMPRRGSGPELALRRELHALGLRFRLTHPRLPGRPDVMLTKPRIACFVDGCFWHACPEHGTLPKNNRPWWEAKLRANRERDDRKDRELTELGWHPVHVWEHEDMREAAARIAQLRASRLAEQPVHQRGRQKCHP